MGTRTDYVRLTRTPKAFEFTPDGRSPCGLRPLGNP